MRGVRFFRQYATVFFISGDAFFCRMRGNIKFFSAMTFGFRTDPFKKFFAYAASAKSFCDIKFR